MKELKWNDTTPMGLGENPTSSARLMQWSVRRRRIVRAPFIKRHKGEHNHCDGNEDKPRIAMLPSQQRSTSNFSSTGSRNGTNNDLMPVRYLGLTQPLQHIVQSSVQLLGFLLPYRRKYPTLGQLRGDLIACFYLRGIF